MSSSMEFTPLIIPNGGINESVSPQKIKQNEWTSALNVEPLFDGCRRRNGSTLTNSSTLSDPIVMVADYRLSDAATAYHLVMAAGKLYTNISGTLTQVSGAASGDLTHGQDVLPTWAVMNDRFSLTNDVEVSRIFYDLGSTLYYENEGIAAPTATPTVGVSGTGNNLAEGVWFIDYYYWNDGIGVSSDRRYNGIAAASATVTSAGEQIDISSLPAAVLRTGDRATHIRIEAKGPSQTIFRYVKQVAVGTTTTTITDADMSGAADYVPTGVEAEYEHAVAPVHKLKATAENRQFIADIEGFPYRLMFSSIIGTTPHYHSFPALNKRDFGKGDGDYITALAFIAPRTLIVGMKNSIRAIDARRPGTSDVVTISKNIGIAGPHALKVVGKRMFFLSDADENKGPYMLESGSEPQPILGIDDTYKSLNATRMKFASCAHLAPGDTRYQVWFLVTTAGSTAHDRVLVYDYVLRAWTIYSKASANVLGQIEESSVSKVYIGGSDGEEYLQDIGTGDGTHEYASKVTFPVYDMGDNHTKKRFRWVDYVVSGQTLGAINLNAMVDYGRSSSVQAVLTQTVPGGSATWNAAEEWDVTSSWGGGSEDVRARTPMCGRGYTFQPRLSFSSTKTSGESFHLKGISYGYQKLRNKVVA